MKLTWTRNSYKRFYRNCTSALGSSDLYRLGLTLIVFLSSIASSSLVIADSRISWSERPGCFERHLQRRHNNPLFPMERQHVTAADVAAARRRDEKDLASLRTEYVQFMSEIAQLPDDVPSREINPLLERIDNLTHRAAEVGEPASPLASELRTARAILIGEWLKALSDNPNALKALQEAEAFYQAKVWRLDNPFVAQLKRNDTPIAPDDVVPALLTEDVTTIRTVIAILGEHARLVLYRGAIVLVREVRARGETVPGIDKKLATLGTTLN